LATDTMDLTGQTIETCDVIPDEEQIKVVLTGFNGGYDQMPPKYSAIKIDGKRACDRMRAGESVDLQSRSRFVEIHSLVLEEHNNDSSVLRVRCGKGTYVRALCFDIARKLKTCAHVTKLVRTKVGVFDKNNRILLGNWIEVGHKDGDSNAWLSITEVLDDIPALSLDQKNVDDLYKGRIISQVSCVQNDITYLGLDPSGKPVGILCADENKVRPKRMFNI